MPVQIQVYYETLCPDSIRFVAEQLYPTYQKLGQYLNIEFIPYGFASVISFLRLWSLHEKMEKTIVFWKLFFHLHQIKYWTTKLYPFKLAPWPKYVESKVAPSWISWGSWLIRL